LHVPEYQKQMVRVGGVIHGQEIFDDGQGTHPQPVTVTGRIAEVRHIGPDQGVGYGLTYQPDRKKYIGTIPAGYADGRPRALGGTVGPDGVHAVNGHVKVNGQSVDIVGKMSMDMTTVDLDQLLLGKMAEPGGVGTDPDLRLWKKMDGGELVPDKQMLSRANVVFSDKTHTMDDVARESGLNSSMVQIGLGNSPRVNKVHLNEAWSGATPAEAIAARATRGARTEPLSAEEIETLRTAEIPNTESHLPPADEEANG